MNAGNVQLITMAFAIVAAFCTIFGVWYKMDRDTNAKIDSISQTFSEQLANAIESGNKKRSRIYERVDTIKDSHKQDMVELRKEVMESFVPTKICTIMHSNSDKSIAELKLDIANLDKKVEKLVVKLYEKNGD